MFSLVEVVEDWNDIYCKACDPEAPPPTPQPSRAAASGAHLPRRNVPISRPRWWEAAYGAEVPLMFLIKERGGRRRTVRMCRRSRRQLGTPNEPSPR